MLIKTPQRGVIPACAGMTPRAAAFRKIILFTMIHNNK
jgi:hypothetical protein